MSLRILIVPDKFKGTLTAPQAASAIAQGWSDIRPDDCIEELPMADGGDGFGEVLGQLLKAKLQTCATLDSAGRARIAEWWLNPDTHTAIVETAQVNGLALLPVGQYHPFKLDTFGIGAVFKQAAQAGARRLYVGIGGSATNDGGFGLARSLGWSFWNGNTELDAWTQLDNLTHVKEPSNPLSFEELIIAVDVTNPLLGADGASRVYGPQKGLRKEVDLLKAEACLARLAEVMAVAMKGEDFSFQEGAGAAGGLGFALKTFCGGRFESGAEIFVRESGLKQRIHSVDLVITGEGAMDAQTLNGKGVGVIAKVAASAGKRCLCLAGSMSDLLSVPWPNFKSYAIVPDICSLAEAKARPYDWLRQLARRAASEVH